jgi:hypothetical protein
MNKRRTDEGLGNRTLQCGGAGVKTYVLDTNCFINAVTPVSSSYEVLRQIFRGPDSGEVLLMVSRQTLYEWLIATADLGR